MRVKLGKHFLKKAFGNVEALQTFDFNDKSFEFFEIDFVCELRSVFEAVLEAVESSGYG